MVHHDFRTQEWARVMARQHALPPTLAPRLIGREAAAAYVSVAPNTFDAMVREGRLPKPRLLTAGRKAWDVRLLDQAIDGLPLEGESADSINDGWGD
jgi:predicted DNA-binding transcriptional regulator AlpA